MKTWLIWKDPDAGKDWGQEEKGMTEWDDWMASPTQWTWVWVDSGSWWWTGRPGVLRFMGSQRIGHDWATELNWTNKDCEPKKYIYFCLACESKDEALRFAWNSLDTVPPPGSLWTLSCQDQTLPLYAALSSLVFYLISLSSSRLWLLCGCDILCLSSIQLNAWHIAGA